jgi:hypothetical protein
MSWVFPDGNPYREQHTSGYDTMQVCRRGHKITSAATSVPAAQAAFCDKCGAATMMNCDHCKTHIRGTFNSGAFGKFYSPPPPAYCHGCGKPYPWTEDALRIAKELIDESELDDGQKEQLNASIHDVLQETPGTGLAVARFKKLLPRMGKAFGDALYKLVVDIGSEATVKLVKGGE